MNKFEFISLKEYPEGQYPTEIATIAMNLKDFHGNNIKQIFRYAKKTTKDGRVFWTTGTHNVLEHGMKEYITDFELDSKILTEQLIDFIKENVKNWHARKAQSTGEVHYPHGMAQSSYTAPMPPNSISEMNQEEIPF